MIRHMPRAAVLYEAGQPLRVEEVELASPQSREVRVRVLAAGVCHSDYHYMKGDLSTQLPAVLGHEGAGVVEAIGDDAGVGEMLTHQSTIDARQIHAHHPHLLFAL